MPLGFSVARMPANCCLAPAILLQTEFLLAITRAKAAILKLSSLEYHFLSATYRAEDIVALNKIHQELITRILHLKTQLHDVSGMGRLSGGGAPLRGPFHQEEALRVGWTGTRSVL